MVRLTKIALLGQDVARDASAAGGFTAPMIMAAAKQAIALLEKDGKLKQNKPKDIVIQMQPAVCESDAPAGEDMP
jgi:hypothetical protein